MTELNINKLSGYEIIEFEKVTGLNFVGATDEATAARDEGRPPDSMFTLGVTYLMRRRNNKDLTWHDHMSVDWEVSVGLVEEVPDSAEEDSDPKEPT